MSDRGETDVFNHSIQDIAPGWEWTVVTNTTAVLIVSILSGWVLGLPTLIYALAVPIGICFGVPGALGFAIGRLFFSLWTNSVAAVSVVQFAGDLFLVVTAFYVWNGDRLPALGDRLEVTLRGVVRYVLTGSIALICNVAVVSIGLMLLGWTRVAAAVPGLLVDRSGVVIVVGIVVLLALQFVVETTSATPERIRPLTNWNRVGLVLLGFGWVCGTVALGLVRQDITSIPGAEDAFFDYVPGIVLPIVKFVLGPAYQVIQSLGAALLILIVLLWLFHTRPEETADSDTENGVRTL